MASLKELNLTNDSIGDDVDYANLPKVGAYAPPLPPGKYRFRLPTKLGDIWEKVTSKEKDYLNAIFDQNAPLVVVQSKDNTFNGDPFTSRVSNVPRGRGKDKLMISDMDYLLKTLGSTTKPKSNPEYAKALISFAGKEFDATVEWQWSCNPNKDIYVDDGNGSSVPVEGKKGCGARFYQNQVEKVDGKVPERITCSGTSADGSECNASLRAFPQLASFG